MQVRARFSSSSALHGVQEADHAAQVLDARRREEMVDMGEYGLHSPCRWSVVGPGGQRIQPDHTVHRPGEAADLGAQQFGVAAVPTIRRQDAPMAELPAPAPTCAGPSVEPSDPRAT